MAYSSDFKLKLCKLVCDEGIPVSKVAEDHNIERRTLQAWLRTFRENPYSFHREYIDKAWVENNAETSEIKYQGMSEKQLRKELMKKDIEIARLKKGYAAKGVGAKKEYVTFFKKNTK